MAKYGEGTNYTKAADPKSDNILDPGTFAGKVRVMQDSFTWTGNLNSTDYIVVGGKLPTGAEVVEVILSAGTPTATASNLLVAGDEGDADRYMTSALYSSNIVRVGPTVSTGMGYRVTGTTDNYIRVAGAAANAQISAATGKITVAYIVE